MNSVKWNVDASYSERLKRYAIEIIWATSSVFFRPQFLQWKINYAEVLGIHRAMSITWADSSLRNSSSVILESDSANAVAWCNNDSGGP